MRGHLTMSIEERKRKSVFDQVASGYIRLTDASHMLWVTYRHCKRLWRRYREQGDTGLIHASRGRSSNRGYSADFKAHVLTYYEHHLLDFGPTLASEKLNEAGYKLDHETLRRWLLDAGLWSRHRRRRNYRRHRQRRQAFGELVQLDGSFHDWFEDGTKYCLMNMVDDATGTTQALLAEEETTEAALKLLWRWIDCYGLPQALYTDKRNVYVTHREPTWDEQLVGEEPLTAFGRACQQLGIRIIRAHSPQAKGRVERSNGVYQDRFIKELRYQGITTMDQANQLLRQSFCDQLNQRYSQWSSEMADVHTLAPNADSLWHTLCWTAIRQLQNDWTVSYSNQLYQIHKPQADSPIGPKKRLQIRRHLDHSVSFHYQDTQLKATPIEARPEGAQHPTQPRPQPQRSKRKPGANSPWRQYNPDYLKKKTTTRTW